MPSLTKIILAFLPVSSKISCLLIICLALPMLLISIVTTRSRPLCVILVMRPSSRCLRRSMQKAGGVSGRSGVLSGIYKYGEAPEKSAAKGITAFSVLTSSRRLLLLGIKTLYILPPSSFFCSWLVRIFIVIPSKFMEILLFSLKICVFRLLMKS